MPILILFLLAIAIVLFTCLIRNHRSWKNAPVCTQTVTVFAKTMRVNRIGSDHYVAFSFPDGTRKNLFVTLEQYNTLREGEVGVLTYKQRKKAFRFVSFQPTT